MICKKEYCTGCFACINICPKNCISMQEDEFGAIYPTINIKDCINCNMCRNICPSFDNENDGTDIIRAYACLSKDIEIRLSSSSGGVASELSKSMIENGGVVYSAIMDKSIDVIFSKATTVEETKMFKGSKYVHSKINYTYKSIKEDLNKGINVLFIGLPCQVHGLNKFLRKDYENLVCIDLICHGAPTIKLLREEINNKVYINNVDRVTFRENNEWKLSGYNDKNLIFEEKRSENSYFQSFSKGMIFRDNCYICRYAKPKRYSDITIGDFWGLGKDSKFTNDTENGISVVLTVTTKGERFINENLEKFYYEERTIDEAINGNHQLIRPTIKSDKYYKFKDLYLKYGYKQAMKKCIGNEIKINKLKSSIKKIINK